MDSPDTTAIATLPDSELQALPLDQLARNLEALQAQYTIHGQIVVDAKAAVTAAEATLKQTGVALERYKAQITKRLQAIRTMA